MAIEFLSNWNPWWNTGAVPDAFKGHERDIDPLIGKSLREKEITILTGIRRSGKTTIMYQMIDCLLKEVDRSQIFYVNLDDESLKQESLEDIYNTYRQNINPDRKAYIFLDEVQNKDGWEKFLKKYYDLKSEIKFMLSGSSASLLKKEYSTLLTGRNLTFTIWPLSFKEFLKFSNVEYGHITSDGKNRIMHALNTYLQEGGFPEAYYKEKDIKSLLLRQYFDDIIYKDVVSRHNINPGKITDLALYMLTNIGNQYTIRKIRNFTGLSIDSIRDYISFLEDAYLISSEEIFTQSAKETNTPRKVYCIDTGLRNAVTHSTTKDIGRQAENLVYTELKRRGHNPRYWKNKGEVDYVIRNPDQTMTAINVTYADEINERENKALEDYAEQNRNTKTEKIIITRDLEKTEGGVRYAPLWKWLLE